MVNIKNLVKQNRFRATAVIGILFIAVGLAVFGYSTYAIQEREQMLNSATLTIEETWRIEGSLRWWRSTYAMVFLPLSVILAAFGTVGLVSQPLWTKMHRKSVLETFADNIRLASRENYERPKFD